MPYTYLDIINIALRDVNEVSMSTADFNAPRGLQAGVKEMTARAYADILNHSKEWPFLSASAANQLTVTTVAGQQEYTFDTTVDHVDWDTFYSISTDSSTGNPLAPVHFDFYVKYMKNDDIDNPEGGVPLFVYRTKDNDGFGVSPLPDDRGFTISFSAWAEPTMLVNATDVIAIPDRYYNVLVARVRYYLWLFRENAQQASFALNEFEEGLKKMHRDLVEKQSIEMRAV